MKDEMLEQVMVSNYHHVFKEILLSIFKSNPKLTPAYLDLSMKRQREVEGEIDTRSSEMARSLVEKLKKKGWLTEEPTKKQLEKEIRRTLEEFKVKE